ncbi:MAG: STAS-like domain-containing protein [Verrucomicrobiales bacterium]|nr:STAS-like domain-containing protein [Verrucomicrobiales bacterium]
MKQPVIINVRDTIGSPLCVATKDGDLVRDRILPLPHQGCPVTLSFAETDVVIPAFVGSAIGLLYGEFSEAKVDALVEVQGLPTGAECTIETARRWAKAYYRDPAAYLKAVEEVLGE